MCSPPRTGGRHAALPEDRGSFLRTQGGRSPWWGQHPVSPTHAGPRLRLYRGSGWKLPETGGGLSLGPLASERVAVSFVSLLNLFYNGSTTIASTIHSFWDTWVVSTVLVFHYKKRYYELLCEIFAWEQAFFSGTAGLQVPYCMVLAFSFCKELAKTIYAEWWWHFTPHRNVWHGSCISSLGFVVVTTLFLSSW